MQASASGVLEEVKRKKTDLKSLLDMAETLRELRTLRREASRKKGESDSYRSYTCLLPGADPENERGGAP